MPAGGGDAARSSRHFRGSHSTQATTYEHPSRSSGADADDGLDEPHLQVLHCHMMRHAAGAEFACVDPYEDATIPEWLKLFARNPWEHRDQARFCEPLGVRKSIKALHRLHSHELLQLKTKYGKIHDLPDRCA